MGKILVLDAQIANQIAAGEVVERPASIVKELIENSIDAGSNRIEIIIQEGGFSSIQVKDNGEGMDEEDVDKAFLRHATSKLKSDKDLFRIKTLGFRGEALPSIAAVSRLTLRTSNNKSGKGIEVKLEGGALVDKKETAYHQGTEILVENLFFNTPARLKYLKSLQTELGHIIDYVNRLSLAHPFVSFTLIHNEHMILRTNGDGKLLHVIAAIYGSEMAKSMIEIADENLDFQLTGYTSKPEITRANKSHISLFINGRYIRNYLLSQAVIRGYKTLLMVNRFPVSILQIQMDPSLVDVNVHPAKLEVRFSKEQELMKFIEETFANSLSEQTFIRQPVKADHPQINYQKPNYQKPVQNQFDFNLSPSSRTEELKEILETHEPYPKETPISKNSINIEEDSYLEDVTERNEETRQIRTIESKEDKLPLLDPIAQYRGTYIIAQSEEGLYLIDQHAAHERIYFEKNLKRMNEETQTSQELLVPITMDFPRSEAEQIINQLHQIKEAGIDIEAFGMQTFIVRAIPQWIPQGNETEILDKMVHMILTRNEIDIEELRKDMIAGMSCKAAIKANHYLTKREMEVLIEQLRETKNPFSCPHGRPIIIHFSNYEIEKMFKRVI